MKILKWLDGNFEKVACVFLMSVLALVLGIQVFMRYVVHQSLGWSEELARYTFVWLVYIAISYGSLKMRHIKIDAGLFLFPKFMRPYVVVVSEALFAIFSVIIAVLAFRLVGRQMMIGSASPALGIPMWIVYLAPFVGFSLTAIRQAQAFVYRIRHFKDDQGTAPVKV